MAETFDITLEDGDCFTGVGLDDFDSIAERIMKLFFGTDDGGCCGSC